MNVINQTLPLRNHKELNIVADEIDKLQFNIKTNINTNSNTMSKSEIKAMKALLKKIKGYKIADYPVTFDNYSREISLPVYYDLTDEQLAKVIESVISLKNYL